MDDVIYFRSRCISLRTGSSHGKIISGRTSEVSEIRQFEQSDDARDIAWKQSAKSETEIFTKVRQGDATHNIILIRNSSPGDEFSIPSHLRSRTIFFEELDRAIKRSKRILRISYKKILNIPYSLLSTSIDLLIKNEVRDSIILILTDSLESDIYSRMTKLSKYNDVIILHVFHPLELDPSIAPEILFESRSIHVRKYIGAFEKVRKECEKVIKKSGLSYLLVSSEEDPVMRLNFFFKNRYVR